MAPYGVAHYVFHHHTVGQYGGAGSPIALCCSNTHLCVFGDFEKTANLEQYSDSERSEDSTTSNKEKTLKLCCRIKKKFDMAVFTPEMKFILASHGGTVDCLKIEDRDYETGFKAQYFATIDAHGQEISRILVTDEDVLFMTASKDSSLKFYMLARAGLTQKYIPNFDHTEHDIKEIFPGVAMAVTFSQQSRFIYQWDIVTGKIRRIFQHPENNKFQKCATTENMKQLVAIDEYGKCFRWSLQDKEKSTLGRSRLKRRTTSKLKPHSTTQSQAVVEAPDPDFEIECGIKLDKTSGYQNIHMMLFDNDTTVVAFKNNSKAYITNMNDGGKTEEINDIKGPVRFALKIKNNALLISDSECTIINTEDMGIEVFELNEILGSTFANLADVSYASAEDTMLFTLPDKLVMWKLGTGASIKSSIQLTAMNQTSPKHILRSDTCISVVMDKETKEFCRINVSTGVMTDMHQIKKKNQPVQHAKVTPDGQYLLYVAGDKDLNLIRLCDGKLLAWYTMHNTVLSLSVSSDSWYVLVGTSDKRLFVLVIADPLESSHDKRIAHVRCVNPPLTQEQMVTLIDDVNNFDSDSDEDFDSSDDEYIIERATKRMNQRADNALGKKVKVLYSSDSSGEDEQDKSLMKRSKSRANRLHEEHSMIAATPVSAIDGDLYTSGPCSLQ